MKYTSLANKIFIGTIILGGIGLTSCNQTAEIEKPNIIFIMVDDMGYAEAGCYGQEIIETPNIDKLAAEGMRFTQCYSGSSVCAPARSVLMTGLHTGHTTVRGNAGLGGVVGLAGVHGRISLKEEDITIAELLQDAGYVTGMVGKWGLGEPNTTGIPNLKGFDEFYGFLNQRRAHTYYPEYIWEDTTRIELPGNRNGQKREYTHDMFADRALNFLERHSKDPFFLYVPFCIPHNDYEIPDNGIYEEKDWSDAEKAYASMITRMDKNVGRIMQSLKDLGIDDNTYVFFTSDNGVSDIANSWGLFNSGGVLRGTKRDPYEGGIRVPMIVRQPQKISAGQTNDLVWYFADVMPTLSEIANVPVPENIDGVSILPTLLGSEQDLTDRYLYWEFYELNGWRVTRFGDWKAVQHNMHSEFPDPIELYNLKDDVSEATDISLENPEIIKKVKLIFEKAHTPSEEFVWKYLLEGKFLNYDI